MGKPYSGRVARPDALGRAWGPLADCSPCTRSLATPFEDSGTCHPADSFTYDAASRMLTGVKGEYSNTVAFTYDAGGRKATEALTIAGQTYSVGVAYDTAGRDQTLTYPDGTTVGRTYDSRSLLSTIAYGGGNIDTRTYDAGGRLSSETLGNGQVVTRTYLTGDNLPLAISKVGQALPDRSSA